MIEMIVPPQHPDPQVAIKFKAIDNQRFRSKTDVLRPEAAMRVYNPSISGPPIKKRA